jgi:serine protease Do
MTKRLFVALPGVALLATALAVLPHTSFKASAATSAQDPQPEQAAQLRESVRAQVRAQVPRAAEQIRAQAVEMAAEQAAAPADEPGAAAQWFQMQGEDDRGWLGVTIAEVTAEKAKELKLPAERGVLLAEVEADSPAAKAGLKANDVVTEYNGQRVESTAQFRRLVRETPAGRTAQLTFWRDGRSQSASVQLGNYREHAERSLRSYGPKVFDFHFDMPDIDAHVFALEHRTPLLGISAEDLSGQLGSYFGAPDGEGILVREVRAGSPAEKAGLKAGDVIAKVQGERVRNVGELREKLREKRESKTVSLGVIRKGAEMSLNVEIEQPKPPERKKIISHRTLL